VSPKPRPAATTGATTHTIARSPIADQATPTPSPSAAPATAKTRIRMVEVGTFNCVNTVPRANATPITTIFAPRPNGRAVSRSATVRSTP
jgi:hypothetical protein